MPVLGALKTHWYQILLAVADRPLHGYAIRQEVTKRTEGTIELWPGLMYRSIRTLLERGWISEVPAPADAPDDARRRRFYAITPTGMGLLAEETARLEAYVSAARDKNVPLADA